MDEKIFLDKTIERKKEILNIAISCLGVMHKQTIRVSQQLDKLIVRRMSLGFRC